MIKIKTTSEVPSAYQFAQSECLVDKYGKPDIGVEDALKEFAKLHVKQALKTVINSMDKILANDHEEIRIIFSNILSEIK